METKAMIWQCIHTPPPPWDPNSLKLSSMLTLCNAEIGVLVLSDVKMNCGLMHSPSGLEVTCIYHLC